MVSKKTTLFFETEFFLTLTNFEFPRIWHGLKGLRVRKYCIFLTSTYYMVWLFGFFSFPSFLVFSFPSPSLGTHLPGKPRLPVTGDGPKPGLHCR